MEARYPEARFCPCARDGIASCGGKGSPLAPAGRIMTFRRFQAALGVIACCFTAGCREREGESQSDEGGVAPQGGEEGTPEEQGPQGGYELGAEVEGDAGTPASSENCDPKAITLLA